MYPKRPGNWDDHAADFRTDYWTFVEPVLESTSKHEGKKERILRPNNFTDSSPTERIWSSVGTLKQKKGKTASSSMRPRSPSARCASWSSRKTSVHSRAIKKYLDTLQRWNLLLEQRAKKEKGTFPWTERTTAGGKPYAQWEKKNWMRKVDYQNYQRERSSEKEVISVRFWTGHFMTTQSRLDVFGDIVIIVLSS